MTLRSMYVLYESRAVYETMRKIMVDRDKPYKTIKYCIEKMRLLCRITAEIIQKILTIFSI
jgi:hypothetical protein